MIVCTLNVKASLTSPGRFLAFVRRIPVMDLETQILATVSRRSYQPLKPKSLARKLNLSGSQYGAFRKALRDLLNQGRVELGKNSTVRPAAPHGTAVGILRKTGGGFGFV